MKLVWRMFSIDREVSSFLCSLYDSKLGLFLLSIRRVLHYANQLDIYHLRRDTFTFTQLSLIIVWSKHVMQYSFINSLTNGVTCKEAGWPVIKRAAAIGIPG